MLCTKIQILLEGVRSQLTSPWPTARVPPWGPGPSDEGLGEGGRPHRLGPPPLPPWARARRRAEGGGEGRGGEGRDGKGKEGKGGANGILDKQLKNQEKMQMKEQPAPKQK